MKKLQTNRKQRQSGCGRSASGLSLPLTGQVRTRPRRAHLSTALLAAAGILCLSAVQGCAPKPGAFLKTHDPALVWPPPPEPARIQYLYAISGADDIGSQRSLFEKVVHVFAGEGTLRNIVRPQGVFFSPEEVLFVADPGLQSVHVFDLKNTSYTRLKKHKDQRFLSPIGLAMDEAGNLYVSDSVLRKIFVFDSTGEPLAELGGADMLQRPTGIVIHSLLQRLYVVDTVGHAIRVFDLSGNMLFSFGRRGRQPGEFNYPTAVCVDREGTLYVNDSLNFRIQRFTAEGAFLSLFGNHGDGIGEFSQPKGIALDSGGHIYVADAIFDTVQIFNPEGALLLTFGEAGQGPGQLWIPVTIFITQENRIFVSDSYNQRIQVFQFLGGSGS